MGKLVLMVTVVFLLFYTWKNYKEDLLNVFGSSRNITVYLLRDGIKKVNETIKLVDTTNTQK